MFKLLEVFLIKCVFLVIKLCLILCLMMYLVGWFFMLFLGFIYFNFVNILCFGNSWWSWIIGVCFIEFNNELWYVWFFLIKSVFFLNLKFYNIVCYLIDNDFYY